MVLILVCLSVNHVLFHNHNELMIPPRGRIVFGVEMPDVVTWPIYEMRV